MFNDNDNRNIVMDSKLKKHVNWLRGSDGMCQHPFVDICHGNTLMGLESYFTSETLFASINEASVSEIQIKYKPNATKWIKQKGSVMLNFDVSVVISLNSFQHKVALPMLWDAVTLKWRQCDVHARNFPHFAFVCVCFVCNVIMESLCKIMIV